MQTHDIVPGVMIRVPAGASLHHQRTFYLKVEEVHPSEAADLYVIGRVVRADGAESRSHFHRRNAWIAAATCTPAHASV